MEASAELAAALEEAREKTHSADDEKTLQSAIDAWRSVLEIDPASYTALHRLGDLELLYGAAYATTQQEKKDHYHASLRWSERALYTIPAFRARVDAGDPLWEAVEAVGPEGMEPMIKWATAVFYLYEDTLASMGRFLNTRWLDRTRKVMARMSEVDADWGPGVLWASWGILHIALPPIAGGDRERAGEELERAIDLDPKNLLFRWARGRYLHVQTGNPEGFREDLEWVLDQDPELASSPFAWNVYFQRDAEDLLEGADRLFP